MMKATGLKRGSRRKQPQQQQQSQQLQQQHRQPQQKQQPQITKKPSTPSTAVSQQQKQIQQQPQPRQQPPQPRQQQQQQQQQRRQMDDVTALTTKNYRLAKELADLRVKFRDEQKNVTRLTMENMNLASRCREAISHTAMLKKELEQQQRRTAEALASQREQTQRMTDSLTTSMEMSRKISPSSSRSSQSAAAKDEDEVAAEDVNMSRLVSATPSPLRARVSSPSPSPLPPTNEETEQPSCPSDSTPSDSPRRELLTSMNVVESVGEDKLSEDVESGDDKTKEELDGTDKKAAADRELANQQKQNHLLFPTSNSPPKGQKEPATKMYSTPKRSDRSWAPTFGIHRDEDGNGADGTIFPFSASPQAGGRLGHKREAESYEEGFPSDIIDGASDTSPVAVNKRQVSLVNSIDDFEKSFATDFPDSFTPKENAVSTTKDSETKDIYNPFFGTPERSSNTGKPRSGMDMDGMHTNAVVIDASSPDDLQKTGGSESLSIYRTPEEKKTDEPNDSTPYVTPPRDHTTEREVNTTGSDPGRPEKTTSSAARARYERALQPRKKNDSQPSLSSGNEGPMQISANTPPSLSQIENAVSTPRTMSDSVLDIVDTYESPPSTSVDQQRPQNAPVVITASSRDTSKVGGRGGQTISARLSGVRSLRRSVKQPISYAEPALNTKLRQGDKFFPKSSSPTSDDSNGPVMVSPDGSPVHQTQTITI
eukprot:CAMPEP_0113499644 /NCGR_PEP_ID=MMETSP0014_2-20120614/31862_1 /TAXON_ID=2857 /ORGANISM="Nitzschia sp." /LENGTH=710 /DNA_ID=CAMNT_0000393841 /DNA_START=446 /DNA_END=2578 /DNA_ORIENTATION=+ /assembly_acc=CAM_ASM_000159